MIREWAMRSYRSDPVAFYWEMFSLVFTLSASITLAWTAADPKLQYIYPFFFIGSVSSSYACWRRQLLWPLFMGVYFSMVNVFGFARAMQWI
jgi:hypothetical protein